MLDLKYLNWADAKGKRYYYYRRKKKRHPLPDINHPDFRAEYDRVHAQYDKPSVSLGIIMPGTFTALVEEFEKSADFTTKAKTTQRDYAWHLNKMADLWGDMRPEEITRAALMGYRDTLADKPRQANYALTVARLLFYWAKDLGHFQGENPAAKPRRLKEGEGYRAWSDAEIERYLDTHKGDRDRCLALALGLYAGQRRGDVIQRNRSHWNGAEIVAVANKNGEYLWLPALPLLKTLLNEIMPTRFMMLQRPDGSAFTERSFSAWFAEGRDAAGLPSDAQFHGLRVTAAEILSDFCSDAVMQAIFGWKTAKMAAHYRRRANKKHQASIGIKAWEERMATKSDKLLSE